MGEYFKKKQAAFTLLELLITISIIALISSSVVVFTQGARTERRDAARISDMKRMVFALERYRNVYSSYPDCFSVSNTVCDYGNASSSWFSCLNEALLPFLGEIPKDPNNVFRGYCYIKESQSLDNRFSLSYFLENEDENATGEGILEEDEISGKEYFLYTIILQDFRE